MGKFKEYLNEATVNYTTEDDNHKHIYQTKLDGNGETISTISKDSEYVDHVHKIVKNKVEKYGKHIHMIKEVNESKKENKEERIEAYGVKGMKSLQWRKIFKNVDALNKWIEKNDAEVQGTREIETAR